MTIENITRYVKSKLSDFGIPTSKTLKNIFLKILLFIEEYVKDTVDSAIENIPIEEPKEIIFSEKHPTTLNEGEYYYNLIEGIPLILKKKFPYNPTVKQRYKTTFKYFETGIPGVPFSFGYAEPCDISITDPTNMYFSTQSVDASTLLKVIDIIGNLLSDENLGPEYLWTVVEKGSDYIIIEYNRAFKMSSSWSINVRPNSGSSPREYFFLVDELASMSSTWESFNGEIFLGADEMFYDIQ